MKTSSAKAKGRRLAQWVKDVLIGFSPELKNDDIVITSSGDTGEDLKLSPKAREVYPIQIECKNHKNFAVYRDFDQAVSHGPFSPVLVIKANHRAPLVVVDAELFFTLLGERTTVILNYTKGPDGNSIQNNNGRGPGGVLRASESRGSKDAADVCFS